MRSPDILFGFNTQIVKRIGFAVLLFLSVVTAAPATRAQTAEERPDQITELAYDEVTGKVLNKFVKVKLSPQCWERAVKGDLKDTINRVGIAIMEHAKIMEYGDLGNVGGGSDINYDRVNQIFGKMNGKFSYTIEAAQTTCTKDQWDVMSRFAYYVSEFFSNSTVYSGMGYGWRPKAGKMFVTVVFSPTAKDATVALSADSANFTVTVPSGDVDDLKWNGWQKKIEAGMAKGGAKIAEN